MKQVIVIHKNALEAIPPVLSLLLNLSDLGYKTTLLTCGVQDNNKALLHKKGVDVIVMPFTSRQSVLGKIWDIIQYKKAVYKFLKTIDKNNSILFFEGGNTIFALGDKYKRLGYKYILFLPELLEDAPYQRRAINKVIHKAENVIVPEYCRSYITQIWYNLPKKPVVMPNKPYFEPLAYDEPAFLEKYHEFVEIFKKKKVILYQGHVSYTRDISTIIRAVKELGNDFQVVLMGKDYGIVSEYKKIDPNIIYIPFIPAPDYLVLTRMAYMGILVYTPDLLNTIFCAPNKIFEYTKYGLPVFGNDIPGLRYPISLYRMGAVADFIDINRVKEAILNIDKNYEEYKKNCLAYYDSVDNKETIRKVIEEIS